MKTATIYTVKATLSQLAARAEAGEEILPARGAAVRRHSQINQTNETGQTPNDASQSVGTITR